MCTKIKKKKCVKREEMCKRRTSTNMIKQKKEKCLQRGGK